jgi:hypothetical protein
MEQTTFYGAIAPAAQKDRRGDRRAKISRLALVRPWDPRYKEELDTTLNTSRDGLYLTTRVNHYYVGMRLSVTMYGHNDPCNPWSLGEVVRTDRLQDGSFGIAVRIVMR